MIWVCGKEPGAAEVKVNWNFIFLVECFLAVLSSGFNTSYFLSFHSPRPGRQIAATAMALVSLATLVESLYSGLLSFFYGPAFGGLAGVSFHPLVSLTVRASVLMGTLFISLLIARRMRDE